MRPGKKNIAMALLLTLLTSAAICQEQQAANSPKATPNQILTDWLTLCDKADVQPMTTWVAEHSSERTLKRLGADRMARFMVSDCTENGGYKLMEASRPSPEQVRALIVSRKTGAWSELRMGLTPDNKIDRFGMMPAMPLESALPPKVSDDILKAETGSYVGKLSQAGMFSGIVEVVNGKQPIALVSEGFANRDKKTPITPSTQFTIGSMGKMFTATAVGQLVDAGKLSFEDNVGKFFPNYGNKTVREKVTVGMLLSHTSGMGDFLAKRTPEMMKNGVKRASEFIPLYENDEPAFEPGTSWAYSNAGLALAGAIVEKASGEAYPDYIRKHIFQPAGMVNSDPNNVPHENVHLVTPYTHSGEGGQEWREAEHDIGSPAGGAISTAEDLVRFASALRSGKLVSKATFAKMIQPHGKTPWGAGYGYGLEVEHVYGRTVVGHGGGFPGVSAHLYILVDSPYSVVALSNQDPPAAEIAAQIPLALTAQKANGKE